VVDRAASVVTAVAVNRLCAVLVVTLCAGLVSACGNEPPRPEAPVSSRSAPAAALANGLYAVAGEQREAPAAGAPDPEHIVLPYDPMPVDGEAPPPRRWIELDPSSTVPLIVQSASLTEEDARGLPFLSVTLDRSYTARLEDFTREHLGGRVAVVLDGNVVTVHKVRSVLTDGKMQISRCTDRACTVIRSSLLGE
jgi:hypothetical protein